jgi:hypothetical protein
MIGDTGNSIANFALSPPLFLQNYRQQSTSGAAHHLPTIFDKLAAKSINLN